MEMAVPFTASTDAASAVNGGAMMMSQWDGTATSGLKALKYARASACVLYIFQLPAITGRRILPRSVISKSVTQENTEDHRVAQRNLFLFLGPAFFLCALCVLRVKAFRR
jgi:hypothetical protein